MVSDYACCFATEIDHVFLNFQVNSLSLSLSIKVWGVFCVNAHDFQSKHAYLQWWLQSPMADSAGADREKHKNSWVEEHLKTPRNTTNTH